MCGHVSVFAFSFHSLHNSVESYFCPTIMDKLILWDKFNTGLPIVQSLWVIWGQCCPRVAAAPSLPNSPIMQLSLYFTREPGIWILRSFIKYLQYMLSAKEGMPKRIKLGMLCEFIAYKDRLKTMLQVALFLQVSWGKSRNKFTKPGASNLANLCTSWQEKMQDVDQHYNSIKEMMKITFVYNETHILMRPTFSSSKQRLTLIKPAHQLLFSSAALSSAMKEKQ